MAKRTGSTGTTDTTATTTGTTDGRRSITPDRLRRLSGRDQLTAMLLALIVVFLIVGGWAVGYINTESGRRAYLNDTVIGVLLFVCVVDRLARPLRVRFTPVLVILFGAWLVAAPLAWGYSGLPTQGASAARMTEWVTGSLIIILGLLSLVWEGMAGMSPRKDQPGVLVKQPG